MRARVLVPILLAAAALAGCGDTLVDHDGGAFVETCNQPGQHYCDRGTGAVCEPVSETSCGDGLACTDCTTLPRPTLSKAICQSNGTCGYECDQGWLRCDAGCCRAIAVAAGRSHTCAIAAQPPATSGQLKCWGANDRGQLGVGDSQDRLVPSDVVGMGTGVTLVAAGASHTCAVKGGTLYCWGANGEAGQLDGRLGVTTSGQQYNSPQTVLRPGVTALALGERHTCALAAGDVYCWGSNGRGQLGSPAQGDPTRQPPATPTLTGASAVASGRAHVCALVSGAVRCWGANDWGQVGNGAAPLPAADQPSPVAAGSFTAAVGVAAGARHSCAIDATTPADPLLWCWGENTDGQLGRGTVGGAFSTPDVAADVQSLRPVAAAGGRAHTCGNKGDLNGIKCFGSNASGQLGGPGPAATKIDVQIGQAATAIAAGDDHGCALAVNDAGVPSGLLCWGANTRGQVGDGSTASGVFLPRSVSGR